MLRGNLELFTQQISSIVSTNFKLAYPVSSESVDNHTTVLLSDIKDGLLEFIQPNEDLFVRGRVGKARLQSMIVDKVYSKLLTFTPNLTALVNRRTSIFVNGYKRDILTLYRVWETKDDKHTRLRTRRVHVKAISDHST